LVTQTQFADSGLQLHGRTFSGYAEDSSPYTGEEVGTLVAKFVPVETTNKLIHAKKQEGMPLAEK
jgi:hypothetical protein